MRSLLSLTRNGRSSVGRSSVPRKQWRNSLVCHREYLRGVVALFTRQLFEFFLELTTIFTSRSLYRKQFCSEKISTMKRTRAWKFLVSLTCASSLVGLLLHRRHLDQINNVQDILIEKTVSIRPHVLLRFCIVSIQNVVGGSAIQGEASSASAVQSDGLIASTEAASSSGFALNLYLSRAALNVRAWQLSNLRNVQ